MEDYEPRQYEILQVLLSRRDGMHAKQIYEHVKTVMAWGTCLGHLHDLAGKGILAKRTEGRKTVYSLTKMGRDHCVLFQIRKEVGLLGFEWADELFREGYRVRFLSDLTGNQGQKRWLFAWNPETRDIKHALIFGINEVPRDRYVAQYVDRSRKSDAPIAQTTLHDFVNHNTSDFEDEEQIAAALRKFYNVETHNSFICIVTPSEGVKFGFPSEIGRFDMCMSMGLGHQEVFPFVPMISMSIGGLSLSKNLRTLMYHNLDFRAWHDLSWLLLRKLTGQLVNVDLTSFLFAKSSNYFESEIACAHYNGKCERMGIKCVIDGRVERLLECPILKSDLEQPYTSEESIYNRWKTEFDDWLAHATKSEVTLIS